MLTWHRLRRKKRQCQHKALRRTLQHAECLKRTVPKPPAAMLVKRL